MEAFCEARVNKCRERDLHIRIKEMHIHMRETELNEEDELKQHEKAHKKRGRGLRIHEE
jgi:hypothetical protein